MWGDEGAQAPDDIETSFIDQQRYGLTYRVPGEAGLLDQGGLGRYPATRRVCPVLDPASQNIRQLDVPGHIRAIQSVHDRKRYLTSHDGMHAPMYIDMGRHLFQNEISFTPIPLEDFPVPFLPPSKRPLGEYTTSELNQRKRELQRAATALATAPIRAELAKLLADVEAEEESRREIAQAGPRGYLGL